MCIFRLQTHESADLKLEMEWGYFFPFSFAVPLRAKAKPGVYLYLPVLWHRCVSVHSLRVLPFIIPGFTYGSLLRPFSHCGLQVLSLMCGKCWFKHLTTPLGLGFLIVSGAQGITSLSSQICSTLEKCFYILPSALRNSPKI